MSKRAESRMFMILHFAATLAMPALLALLVGCVKQDFDNTLGPPVPCKDVEAAVNSAGGGAFENRQIGQFVVFRETLAPLSNPPTVARDLVQQLLTDQAHPQYSFARVLTYLETNVTYEKDGSTTTDTKEIQSTVIPDIIGCPEADAPLSFHNLKVDKHKAIAPSRQCTGAACEIEVTDVQFDLKIDTPEDKERQRWTYTLSNNVPLFAREMKRCRSLNVDVNGQSVPMTSCLEVIDYGVVPSPTPTPTP